MRAPLFAWPILVVLSSTIACGDRPAPTVDTPPPTDAASARRVVIPVQGMVCDGCADAIAEAVTTLPGVARCSASYSEQHAVVDYDPARVDEQSIVAAIVALGYRTRTP